MRVFQSIESREELASDASHKRVDDAVHEGDQALTDGPEVIASDVGILAERERVERLKQFSRQARDGKTMQLIGIEPGILWSRSRRREECRRC